jgi:DNA-directed RNA polymerases I, II, and III subunit RPABC1
MSDQYVARLHKVYKTVMAMLLARGYLVSDEETSISLEAFKQLCASDGTVSKKKLTLLKRKPESSSAAAAAAAAAAASSSSPSSSEQADTLFVFFPDAAKPGVAQINSMFDEMKSERVPKAVIVVEKGLTSLAKTSLTVFAPDYVMEHFLEAELLVNITQHELVPQHTLLTADEKRLLLERHKLKETQLPRILVTDPVARFYGLRRGDVVKIRRPSETAGEYITYRFVL